MIAFQTACFTVKKDGFASTVFAFLFIHANQTKAETFAKSQNIQKPFFRHCRTPTRQSGRSAQFAAWVINPTKLLNERKCRVKTRPTATVYAFYQHLFFKKLRPSENQTFSDGLFLFPSRRITSAYTARPLLCKSCFHGATLRNAGSTRSAAMCFRC